MTNKPLFTVDVWEKEGEGGDYRIGIIVYRTAPRFMAIREEVSGRNRVEAVMKANSVLRAILGGEEWHEMLRLTE